MMHFFRFVVTMLQVYTAIYSYRNFAQLRGGFFWGYLFCIPPKSKRRPLGACTEVLCDLGSDSKSFCFESCGKKRTGNLSEAYGESFDVGDTIHCEVGFWRDELDDVGFRRFLGAKWVGVGNGLEEFVLFCGDVAGVLQPTKKL